MSERDSSAVSVVPTRSRVGARPVWTVWFGLTTFVGAALLFSVEPMVGKMLLPALGGAPAVWATCLVFFQVALLAGYAWAHGLSRLPPVLQVAAHGALVAAAFGTLPLHAPAGAPDPHQTFPALWLLSRLAASVGLPFVALSATGPLVQHWFSSPASAAPEQPPRDPYFLFAASNAGSLLALLAYPVAIEPLLALRVQSALWSRGYALQALLLGGSAIAALAVPSGARVARDARPAPVEGAIAPTTDPRWRWFALALVPSALVCSVTTFVTTDVAPVPLLWVIPLALYLASFVVPFARPSAGGQGAQGAQGPAALRLLPVAVLALAFTLVVGADRLLWLVVLLHFGGFFAISLACHGELARTRPPAERLTSFYLIIAAGGAAGGALVALVAPLVFPAVWEYPLALIAVCGLRAWMPSPRDAEPGGADFDDLARAEGFGARRGPLEARVRKVARVAGMPAATVVALTLALRLLVAAEDIVRVFVVAQITTAACVVAWAWRARVWRFASMLVAMLAAPALATFGPGMLFVGRSFFAVHRVANEPAERRHLYAQGTTVHGLQSTLPERARVPGAYFHRSGPAGDVLAHLARGGPSRIGLVGLGVASLAAYAEGGERFTFYEIDPVVARIAEDPRLFTFLRDARDRGAQVDVLLGDARIRLAEASDSAFDVLVLDAYSSDVVPTHLLTREAFALYLRKLSPAGFVLMNVSNRYLDLGRVVGALAADAGLSALARLDELTTEADKIAAREDGKAPSRWIVVARRPSDLEPLELSEAWKPLPNTHGMRPWTDDYVNVVGCFRF
jgi:hypothetical protein